MESIYGHDLAYIQAVAFGEIAQGAAAEIVRRLQRSTTRIRRVMDVGCGAGQLSKALTDAGFDVTGVDTSAELLQFACMNAPKAHFIHASAYDVELQTYDAVVALGEPLTYHDDTTQAEHLVSRFFQRVAGTLPVGGLLIFDVIGLGESSLVGRTWKSGEDWAVLVETTEDQNQKTLLRNIEIFRRVDGLYRRGREVHRVRLFDVTRLCDELVSYGFRIETAQSYGTQPLPPRRHAIFATRIG